MEFTIANKKCAVIYRSPNIGDQDPLLQNYLRTSGPFDLILGAFNLPHIDWQTQTSSTHTEETYLELFQDLFLHQHVEEPTHERGNVLDLVFTQDESFIHDIKCLKEESISDHYPLFIELDMFKKNHNLQVLNHYDYKHMNKELFRNMLSDIDWTSQLHSGSANDMWIALKEQIHGAMSCCIPMKPQRAQNQPLWLNRTTMRSIRKKRRIYKRFLNTKQGEDFLKYKEAIRNTQKEVRRSKKEFEKSLVDSKNRSTFYKYLSGRSKIKEAIGVLKDTCGNEITSHSGKAGLLNDFFAKVLTVEGQGQLPHIDHNIPEEESIQTVFFSPEDVWKSISSCKDSLSCGSDDIPSRIFKIAGETLAYPLSMIYNVSMSTGVVPDDWKEANITAIFKKGSRTSPSNYRPISLTSVACRLMERCIKAKVMDHLEEHNILVEAQHGFQKRKSTLTNLLDYMEAVTDAVDQGLQVDAVYFDFKKAFDKVPHRRLLAKLEAVGIRGPLLNWLKSWLTGRRQRVCVNDQFSDWTTTTSSVPQGSVLGPILFLIYINDLQSVVEGYLSMFADDTKLYRVIKDKISDKSSLQLDIDAMLNWSKDWLMEFNIEKCSTITFGHGQKNLYTLAEAQLESVNCQKDVGILIPRNLKFDEQCATVINKANSILGQIKQEPRKERRTIFIMRKPQE